jgi:hypothetical protein
MDKDSAYRSRSSVSLAARRSRDTGAFLSPSRNGSFKENRDEAVFGWPRRRVTTVKAIVIDAANDKTIWQDYQRHETRQPEKVLEFLRRMEQDTGIAPANTRIFVTGSGGPIAEMIGAKFVQEVHAVSLAVEKLHPEVYSVIELGGQQCKDHRQGR